MLGKTSKLQELQKQKKGLPKCPVHKTEELSWMCLAKVCPRRIFCAFCVIQDHSDEHGSYASVYEIMDDPLLAFESLGIRRLENIHEPEKRLSESSIKEKVNDIVIREENKLNDIFSNLRGELYARFNQLKRLFRSDVNAYLEKHEETLQQLEQIKLEYIQIIRSLNVESQEAMVKELESLLTKFTDDKKMHDDFDLVLYRLPSIKQTDKYEIQLGKKKLENVTWTNFTDKILSKSRMIFLIFSNSFDCLILFNNQY